MDPGLLKLAKNEVCNFCEVSCTVMKIRENWRKFKGLIFVKFHVPGVMKIREN